MNQTFPPDFSSTEDVSQSRCHVSLLDGNSITFWTCPQTDVAVRTTVDGQRRALTELAISLSPERLVVVGRSTGRSPVPYLDQAYRATTMLPDTQQSVLLGDERTDIWVSRAHFTLRATEGRGVVFTNGVPRAGGGIRPPINGTWLVAPLPRLLNPGEDLLIAWGETVAIRLPNHCVLQLRAH
jgi:hypothetical protein